MNKQKCIGSWVLNRELPEHFESSFITQFSELVSEIGDPFLQASLPYLAAFGYSQGNIFYELRGGATHIKELVTLASAIFNIGINIFDYIVDEFSTGKQIFKIIDHKFLLNLMNLSTPPPSFDLMVLQHGAYMNKREQLLLWLVVAFGICCRRIFLYNKNYLAWRELTTALFQLHDAEKRLVDHRAKSTIIFSQLRLPTIKIKSIVPFLCTYLISKVAWPGISEEQENNIKDTCDIIGNIFWISDDLTDFVKDMKSGTPNYVAMYAEYLTGENPYFFNGIFRVALLHVLEYLFSLLEKLDGIPILTKNIREFVQMYITAWLKW